MKIGIDIDGVINDQTKFHLDCGRRFCRRHHLNCVPDLSAYEVQDIFGWSEADYRKFQQEYYKEFFLTDSYLRAGVKEAVQHLRKKHQINIITARKPTLPRRLEISGSVNEITENWLAGAKIDYDAFFCACEIQEKWTILEHHQIDLMIEDSPIFFMNADVHPSIIAVCFDAPYNRALPKAETLHRVYSWREAIDLINTIDKGI